MGRVHLLPNTALLHSGIKKLQQRQKATRTRSLKTDAFLTFARDGRRKIVPDSRVLHRARTDASSEKFQDFRKTFQALGFVFKDYTRAVMQTKFQEM